MAAARRASTLERGRWPPPRLLSHRCEAPRKVLFEEFAYRVSGYGVCNPGLGRGAQPSNGTLGAKRQARCWTDSAASHGMHAYLALRAMRVCDVMRSWRLSPARALHSRHRLADLHIVLANARLHIGFYVITEKPHIELKHLVDVDFFVWRCALLSADCGPLRVRRRSRSSS